MFIKQKILHDSCVPIVTVIGKIHRHQVTDHFGVEIAITPFRLFKDGGSLTTIVCGVQQRHTTTCTSTFILGATGVPKKFCSRTTIPIMVPKQWSLSPLVQRGGNFLFFINIKNKKYN